MNLTPETSRMLVQMYCTDAENEAKTTRRVLAAVPEGKENYKPAEKSMSALDLAWHIASVDVWFLNGVASGSFDMSGDGARPESIKTAADVVAWYDANFGPAMEKARAISGEHAAKTVSFFGAFNLPNVMYLNFLIKHSVHHRGQLSVYLRPMGAKVPSIYGGSADEPFEMPAAAEAVAQ